jgi:hypothetical protein
MVRISIKDAKSLKSLIGTLGMAESLSFHAASVNIHD